jgi:hypothetical protein
VACSSGADIAAFPADKPALHFVIGYIDDAGSGFGNDFGSAALDNMRQDAACFLIASSLILISQSRRRRAASSVFHLDFI